MTTEASLSIVHHLVVQYEISKYAALETLVLALIQDQ